MGATFSSLLESAEQKFESWTNSKRRFEHELEDNKKQVSYILNNYVDAENDSSEASNVVRTIFKSIYGLKIPLPHLLVKSEFYKENHEFLKLLRLCNPLADNNVFVIDHGILHHLSKNTIVALIPKPKSDNIIKNRIFCDRYTFTITDPNQALKGHSDPLCMADLDSYSLDLFSGPDDCGFLFSNEKDLDKLRGRVYHIRKFRYFYNLEYDKTKFIEDNFNVITVIPKDKTANLEITMTDMKNATK